MNSCVHAVNSSSSLSKRFMSFGPVILVRLTTIGMGCPPVVHEATYTSDDGLLCSVRSRGPMSDVESMAGGIGSPSRGRSEEVARKKLEEAP